MENNGCDSGGPAPAGSIQSSFIAERTGIAVCSMTLDLSRPGTCIHCGRVLDPDDIGAHKKMINRGASAFFCVSCLAAYYCVDEAFIRGKIEYFRASGCALFSRD